MRPFLLTGDERGDPKKLENLLEKRQKPEPVTFRKNIRLEAENFQVLQGTVPVVLGKPASQAVCVGLTNTAKGTIKTELHEIYVAQSGRYKMDVRYRGGKGVASFALLVNGIPKGPAWKTGANDLSWRSNTTPEVLLVNGDEIEVDFEGGGEVDYVELTYLGLNDSSARPGQMIADPSDRR